MHARLFPARVAAMLVLLSSLILVAPGTAQAAGDEIFRSGFESSWLFPDISSTGADVSVKTSADGLRTALLYAGGGAGVSTAPVRYGECAQDCVVRSNWHFVTLGSYGSAGLGGGPRLALDTGGHPRVVWFFQAAVGGNGTLYYAECNASACDSLAAWTIGPVLAFSAGDSMTLLAHGAFALDAQGHPRFIVQDLAAGTFYAQCASNCTASANWTFSQFTQITAQASLAFNASGQPRVAFENAAPNIVDGEELYYASCDSACGSEGNWQIEPLIVVNDNLVNEPFALALDAQGAPRIAFYDDAANLHALAYMWCDQTCSSGAAASNWNAFTTGLPSYSGRKGVALAIDASGIPHLAFGGSPDGVDDASVNTADCVQACSSQPAWQAHQVATRQDIPLPPPDPCATGLSQWQIGTSPDLALQSSAAAHLAFDTYAYFACITGHDENGDPIYTVDEYTGPIGYDEP